MAADTAFFPFGIPLIVTTVMPAIVAAMLLKTGKPGRANRLLVLFCILCVFFLASRTVTQLLPAVLPVSRPIRLLHCFYVFLLPVFLHHMRLAFPLAVGRYEPWAAYGLSCMAFPAAWLMSGGGSQGSDVLLMQMAGWLYSGYGGMAVFFLLNTGRRLVFSKNTATAVRGVSLSEKHSQDGFSREKAGTYLAGLFPVLVLVWISVYLPGSWISKGLNYGYLPFAVFVFGCLRFQAADVSPERLKWFIAGLLAFAIWVPVLVAGMVVVFHRELFFHDAALSRMIPGAIPPLLSFVICQFLALFCFKKGRPRAATMVFGCACALWGILNLDLFLLTVVSSPSLVLAISRADHFFLVLLLGLYAHFFYLFGSFGRRWAVGFYTLSLIAMPLTQTGWYLSRVFEYSWGFISGRGVLFDLFSLIAVAEVGLGVFFLRKQLKRELDPSQKRQYSAFMIGLISVAVLGLANVPAMNGFGLYPLGNFMFVPVLILAYGIFRHDIIQANAYTKKRVLIGLVKGMNVLGYCCLPLMVLFCLPALSSGAVFSDPPVHILPALLSLFCCLFFSLLPLKQGQYPIGSHLFGLICLLYAFFTLETMLNVLIAGPERLLRAGRVSHFFLTQLTGLQIHLVYLICSMKKKWWYVHFSYAAGIGLGLLSQTSFYFSGTNAGSWGYFAGAGPGMTLFLLLMTVNSVIGACLLFRHARCQADPERKKSAWTFFAGFLLSLILMTCHIPIVFGADIYPFGYFCGIPVIICGMTVYSQKRREMAELLRDCLYGCCGLIYFGVTVFLISETRDRALSFPAVAACLGAWVLITRKGARVLRAVLALVFGERNRELDAAFQGIRVNLGKAYSLEDIHKILSRRLCRTLSLSKTVMIFNTGDRIHGFGGWKKHSRSGQGFFLVYEDPVPSEMVFLPETHPLIVRFQDRGSLMTREQVEEWLLRSGRSLPADDLIRTAEASIPIRFEETLMGLLCCYDKSDGSTFSETELRFLDRLGSLLGPYVENARLHQARESEIESRTRQLQQALKEVTLMHDIAKAVNSTLDPDVVLEMFTRVVEPLFPFDLMSVQLRDENGERLKVHRVYGASGDRALHRRMETLSASMEDSRSLSVRSMTGRKPVLVRDFPAQVSEAGFPEAEIYDRMPFRSVMVFPLEIRGEIMGTVLFCSLSSAMDFDSDEMDRLGRYVSQIATAVNNALLYERSETATRAKSDFIARMGHEIRTPLNAIIGAGELLRSIRLPEEKARYVDVLIHAGELLLSIINDILDVSRIESGKLVLNETVFDLHAHIRRVWNVMTTGARPDGDSGAGPDFQLNISRDVPKQVSGDPVKLSQVLVNLIANAIRFTEEGRVSLSVNAEAAATGCHTVSFSVEDTGEGIPKDRLSTIFDSFTQAHEKRGGTGLGLTISRHLAKLMGGDIQVDSTHGTGSRFVFSAVLKETRNVSESTDSGRPVSLSRPPCLHPPATVPFPAGTDPCTDSPAGFLSVLIVEDIETNRLVFRGYLEEWAVSLDMAGTGKQAMEKLLANRYDLVLLDVELPDMSGVDVLAFLRQEEACRKSLSGPYLPVICVSAHLSLSDDAAVEKKLDAFLRKPVRKEELTRKIEQVLAKYSKELLPAFGKTGDDHGAGSFFVTLDEAFRHIVPRFFEEIREELAENQDITEKDLPGIRRLGHGFKGAAGNLGMEDLKGRFAELNRLADIKDIEGVGERIRSIHRYLDQVAVSYCATDVS